MRRRAGTASSIRRTRVGPRSTSNCQSIVQTRCPIVCQVARNQSEHILLTVSTGLRVRAQGASACGLRRSCWPFPPTSLCVLGVLLARGGTAAGHPFPTSAHATQAAPDSHSSCGCPRFGLAPCAPLHLSPIQSGVGWRGLARLCCCPDPTTLLYLDAGRCSGVLRSRTGYPASR